MNLIPNTFNIEARCRRLVEFGSTDELLSLLPEIREARDGQRLLVIGRGSNLLLTGDYDGMVLRSRIMGYEVVREDEESVSVRCGSGVTVDDFIEWAIEHGYYGMENLSLIPGEVGASAVQNIGAYGVEAKDFIETVEVVDLEDGIIKTLSNAECEYSYRQSRFKNEWKGRFVVTAVTYGLSKTYTPHLDYGNIRDVLQQRGIESPTAKELRDAIIYMRKEKLPDPDVEGNAGSFFMNPIIDREKFVALQAEFPAMPHYDVDELRVKIPAGWMIDQCGWKGKCVGNAGVHSRQALVLVNKGGAKGEEIIELCHQVQQSVKERFGVDIKPEVNIV